MSSRTSPKKSGSCRHVWIEIRKNDLGDRRRICHYCREDLGPDYDVEPTPEALRRLIGDPVIENWEADFIAEYLRTDDPTNKQKRIIEEIVKNGSKRKTKGSEG